jgi:restriction system protein
MIVGSLAALFIAGAGWRMVIVGLAFIAAFYVVLIAMAWAAMDAMKRKLALYGADREQLKGIQWRDFEWLMVMLFDLEGYEVKLNSEIGPHGEALADGGVDLIVKKDGKTYVVQCKQWRTELVGVDVVRQTLGAKLVEGADGAIVVTSGEFSRQASDLKEKREDLELWDGAGIVSKLKQHEERLKKEGEGFARESLSRVTEMLTGKAREADNRIEVPRCERCGGRMILKQKQGTTNRFWACSNYGKTCEGSRMRLEGLAREVLGHDNW